MPTKLSVNLNAIAMLRNRRDLPWPSVVDLGRIALRAGASGLTVHPRPDQRHIRFSDLPLLRALIDDEFPQAEFNIEGYPTEEFLALCEVIEPEQVTLVPDDPSQATSDHGWDLVAHGDDLISPSFALDGGEEPEMAGFYIIGDDGVAYRLGFSVANEFSDHVTEKINYLYLAHSKLRPASFSPELLVGALPDHVEGMSRILRDGKTVWEKPFLSGEANMSHTIANLEYHHFKYALFCQPGDLHVHMYGTATLSVADGFVTREGDVFEIDAPQFGLPLRNKLVVAAKETVAIQML